MKEIVKTLLIGLVHILASFTAQFSILVCFVMTNLCPEYVSDGLLCTGIVGLFVSIPLCTVSFVLRELE